MLQWKALLCWSDSISILLWQAGKATIAYTNILCHHHTPTRQRTLRAYFVSVWWILITILKLTYNCNFCMILCIFHQLHLLHRLEPTLDTAKRSPFSNLLSVCKIKITENSSCIIKKQQWNSVSSDRYTIILKEYCWLRISQIVGKLHSLGLVKCIQMFELSEKVPLVQMPLLLIMAIFFWMFDKNSAVWRSLSLKYGWLAIFHPGQTRLAPTSGGRSMDTIWKGSFRND